MVYFLKAYPTYLNVTNIGSYCPVGFPESLIFMELAEALGALRDPQM